MKKMCIISIITIAIDVRIRYGPNYVSAFFDTFLQDLFICNSFFTVYVRSSRLVYFKHFLEYGAKFAPFQLIPSIW